MSSSTTDLEHFEFDALPEDKKFLECPVCLDPWRFPEEITPCGHIFCKACIRNASRNVCMMCREPIASFRPPNRVLIQMVDALPGRCLKCDWTGTAERFRDTHHAASHNIVAAVTMTATAPPPERTSGGGYPAFSSVSTASEYGLQEQEFYLAKAAILAAARTSALAAQAPRTPTTTAALHFEGCRIFARLMGYQSLTSHIVDLFGEFGQDATHGQLNEHQLLLWSSTIAHRRRADRLFGLNEAQYLHLLNDLHESSEFKKNHGVITAAAQVGFVRECRTQALGLPPKSSTTASNAATAAIILVEDDRMFRAILNATRSQVPSGYPAEGVLLRDVLEALASSDDGFELCAASPRGGAEGAGAYPEVQKPTPQQQPAARTSTPPVVVAPLGYNGQPVQGGYNNVPQQQHSQQSSAPPAVAYYAPLPPHLRGAPPAAPYAPLPAHHTQPWPHGAPYHPPHSNPQGRGTPYYPAPAYPQQQQQQHMQQQQMQAYRGAYPTPQPQYPQQQQRQPQLGYQNQQPRYPPSHLQQQQRGVPTGYPVSAYATRGPSSPGGPQPPQMNYYR